MISLRSSTYPVVLICLLATSAAQAQTRYRGQVASTEPEDTFASERSEQAHILESLGTAVLEEAVQKGFVARGLVAPDPAQIGRCIVLRYQSEPEVGFSYAIAQDGAVAASGAGGYARALWEPESPGVFMQADTRMTIASVSKSITAMAMMRVMEESPVGLDDPFYPLIADQYDGWWLDTEGQIMWVPNAGVETVTIRNLLTHRSALKPGLGCGKIPESLASGLVGTPGVTYDYENANFCILRKVIEAVSGMNYIDYVQDRLLTPSGITAMSCEPDAVDPALYYNTIGTTGMNWGSYSATCSAYGWYASAVDLATLVANLRNGALLSEGSIDTMLGNCPDNDNNGYCLGWRRYSSATMGGSYFGHSGDWIANGCGGDCNRGLNSTIRRYPLGIDAAILVNTRSGSGGNPTLTSEVTILNQCYAEALASANP